MKAEVSINRNIEMYQTHLMKVQFSQCRLTVHSVARGWLDSQIGFHSSNQMLLLLLGKNVLLFTENVYLP